MRQPRLFGGFVSRRMCVVARSHPVARPRFLSVGGRGADQAAHACHDRHPHRGSSAAVRSGGTGRFAKRIPPSELSSILDNIGLPVSGINLSYTQLRPDRKRGRGHPGVAQARSSPDRSSTCTSCDGKLVSRVPGHQLRFSAGRHRQPDPEFRPARTDRRADRRARSRGQPAPRDQADRQAQPHRRHRRSAHPAALRPAEAARAGRSYQSAAGRFLAARSGEQSADLVERQLPDDAELLAQSGQSSGVSDRRPDAAIPGGFAAGAGQYPGDRRERCEARDPRQSGDDRTRQRPGIALALQRPAGDRHLWQRAATRPGRRGRRGHAYRRRQPQGIAARLEHRHPRPGADHELVFQRAADRPRRSRSCWSIC